MKEENLEEKITAKTDIGSAIEDFRKSKSPQLAGRSSEERRQAAIAAVLQARRKAKKMDEGFNDRHDSSVNASAGKQIVAELTAYPGTPAAFAASSRSNSMMATQARMRAGEAAQARLAAARSITSGGGTPQQVAQSPMRTQGTPAPLPKSPMRGQGTASPAPKSPMSGQGTPAPLPKSPMRTQGTPAPLPKSPMRTQGTPAPLPKSPMSGQGTSGARPSSVTPTGNPNMAGSGGNVGGAPKPKLRPANNAGGATATAAGARRQQPVAGSQRRAQTSARPSALQRQRMRSKNYRDSAVTGPGGRRG